ncbi:alpha/beta hydrolase [Methanobacterium subterraneum]|jgi:acetyl esterase/lipase|uniref:Alpha/beta hydrolase n=1 Tax=Methanobacterium subterraneum TaxID=59277 RepID=A0A2H4V9K3_9EURY|nr:alpha/beta hydrolase [Methanobacterium subterraneum]AUB54771.1 alpha/beta hydrolase [Methanobacterium subterraneum]PKL72958.1 MAG: alpha/beta hydrolase [Methanobacteriales archaeon HGW-Methanobacteriales-2]
MAGKVDDLLKIITNQFNQELDHVNPDFDEFYLSFSSNGPLKIIEEPDAPVDSYWIVTPQSSPQKIILFFHGGVLNHGTSHGHRDLCQRLSRHTGFSVFSVDYSLASENPFPAVVEDCIQSYLWLRDEGFKSSELVIVGISFGGNLALSTLLALKKMGEKLPLCGVCMSPVVDLKFPVVYNHLKDVNDWINYEMLENFKKSYLKGQNPSNPLASPIYGNLEGSPPLLMQCGSRELLLCDVNRFRDLAIEKDVKVNLEVWQGMFHSWQLFFSHLPESEGSLRSIGDFVKGLSFE